MTLKEMQARMSNGEFVGWRAFYAYREAIREVARKEAQRG